MEKLYDIINKDLISYYFTAGNIYNLIIFSKENEYDLSNIDLKKFLKIIIKIIYIKKII